MPGPDIATVSTSDLSRFCTACFAAVGVAGDDAAIAADTMVEANLRGVDSHGVRHLAGYVRALRDGMANPRPRVSVVREGRAVVVIDGDHGLGQVACARGMDIAVDAATQYGIGAVAIRNSTHSGMVGYYPIRAAAAGCVGFTTSSGTRSNPPYGSTTPLLGGVFAYGIPTSGDPIVLDTVCTNVRPSLLRERALAGHDLPVDWALDRAGHPTIDPDDALSGFRAWMGGPRGSGLAMVMHAFAGVLSGGLVGMAMPAYESTGTPTANVAAYGAERQSHFLSALDVEAFMSRDEFLSRVDQLVRDVHSCAPTDPGRPVMVPGEPEWTTRRRRQAEGIPLPTALITDLARLGSVLGVEELVVE